MKRNKVKGLLVILMIFILVLSSCRKNSDGSTSSSIAQKLISGENSSLKPLVVVPSPESSRKNRIENENNTLLEDASLSNSTLSSAEKDESTLPSASLQDGEENIDNLKEGIEKPRVPSSPIFKSVSAFEVEVGEEEEIISSSLFSHRGITAEIKAYGDRAEITLPSGVTESDIALFFSSLLSDYPYLGEVSYTFSNTIIDLSYPELNEIQLHDYISLFEKEAEKYIENLFKSLSYSDEKEITDVALDNEMEAAKVEKEINEVQGAESEVKTVVEETVKPLTKKGKLITGFTLSLYSSPYFETSYSGFSNIMGVDVLASFSKNISAGLSIGYDFKKYISLEGVVKYNFLDNVYMFVSGGYRFGFDEVNSYSSAVISTGAGYELNINSNVYLFAHAGVIYMPSGYNKFNPEVSFGIRYRF